MNETSFSRPSRVLLRQCHHRVQSGQNEHKVKEGVIVGHRAILIVVHVLVSLVVRIHL